MTFPKYKSHKTVHAGKIRHIHEDTVGLLVFGFHCNVDTFSISPIDPIFARYRPVVGDYLVIYDKDTNDEYCAFSPADKFEAGYTQIEDLNHPATAPIVPEMSEIAVEVMRIDRSTRETALFQAVKISHNGESALGLARKYYEFLRGADDAKATEAAGQDQDGRVHGGVCSGSPATPPDYAAAARAVEGALRSGGGSLNAALSESDRVSSGGQRGLGGAYSGKPERRPGENAVSEDRSREKDTGGSERSGEAGIGQVGSQFGPGEIITVMIDILSEQKHIRENGAIYRELGSLVAGLERRGIRFYKGNKS